MKIVGLVAENIKRLVAVEIRPDGNVVEITGRNGAGKTSVLDAIWWALAGTRAVQAQPIRDGAERAYVSLDLGELIVTRTFRRKDGDEWTTQLTVESADGTQYRSPQGVLDALVGELSFDPLEFTRLRPREQFDRLKALVPDVDFDAVEQANAADYDKRRDLNREAKRLRAQAEGIDVPADLPAEPVDESELVAADRHRQAAQQAEVERDRKRDEAEELRRRAQELDDEADELDGKAVRHRRSIPDGMPDDLSEALQRARETNEALRRAGQRRDLEQQAAEVEAEAEQLTIAMADRASEVGEAVAKADMPVDELTLSAEGQVYLDGHPLDQASDAEQLRVSVALAMAQNPKLRVIRVRDGSLLDDESMRLLADLADEHDCQVWVERVDSSGRVGVVIEDGQVAELAEVAS